MNRDELGAEVYRISHLKGTFNLRSGATSSEYFDKYQFESDPRVLLEVAGQMHPLVDPETEILAGLEMGGIPIVTALSLLTGIPAVFVRKVRKDHGTNKIVEGIPVKGKRLTVVEDVVTSGGPDPALSQRPR